MTAQRILLAALGLWLAGVLSAAAQDRAVIDRVNGYLHSYETLAGNFVQVANDGTLSEGKFFIRRPGRLRFEYADPSPLLVVSDGSWVIVQDKRLKTTDRYPLESTPLRIVVDPGSDISRDAEITSIERPPGQVRVAMRSRDKDVEGAITLVFSAEPFELLQWVVTDAQGLQTTVALREAIKDISLNPALFKVEEDVGRDADR